MIIAKYYNIVIRVMVISIIRGRFVRLISGEISEESVLPGRIRVVLYDGGDRASETGNKR